MQPIQGVSSPTLGEPPGTSQAGEQPLSTQQRTVLERLVTRIVAQGQQQTAEVWAALRHDLGLARDTTLLARHFPAAEQNLNSRLSSALSRQNERQTLAQLTAMLGQGNNRQAVCDYIRQTYNQTALSQLTAEQRSEVLRLLTSGELTIPQPQQRPQTDRPLLPAEHNTLNQAVIKLAAATGEPAKQIWHTLLELAGVKEGELLLARHYAPLTTWLQAQLTLAPLEEVTLRQFNQALKTPLDDGEWQTLRDAGKDRQNLTAQSLLTPVQVQELLSQLVLLRTGQPLTAPIQPQHINPIWRPFIAPIERGYQALSTRPAMLLLAGILIALAIGWLIGW
ncbi:flagellar regulator flk [Salmonella enterica subsp. enterica serovar Choleraesuis]|nr:flagellar regulator flk [Salmonella enterica subsp. enterica serovar Choleraesuis]